jgi:hypothetical protein
MTPFGIDLDGASVLRNLLGTEALFTQLRAGLPEAETEDLLTLAHWCATLDDGAMECGDGEHDWVHREEDREGVWSVVGSCVKCGVAASYAADAQD